MECVSSLKKSGGKDRQKLISRKNGEKKLGGPPTGDWMLWKSFGGELWRVRFEILEKRLKERDFGGGVWKVWGGRERGG